jgi:hypothetical protein
VKVASWFFAGSKKLTEALMSTVWEKANFSQNFIDWSFCRVGWMLVQVTFWAVVVHFGLSEESLPDDFRFVSQVAAAMTSFAGPAS